MKGVELYVSDFQRPLTERIAKDFFSDPAQSAVTCVRTGPVTLDPSINKSPEGEEARVHPRPPAPSLRTPLPPLRPPRPTPRRHREDRYWRRLFRAGLLAGARAALQGGQGARHGTGDYAEPAARRSDARVCAGSPRVR